jgi:hypothetical protein
MKDLRELGLRPGETLFLDRIEEGVATLLLGEGGEREENVPREQLPSGAAEGHWLRVREDGRLEVAPHATEAAREETSDLMAELLAGEHLAPGAATKDGPGAEKGESPPSSPPQKEAKDAR